MEENSETDSLSYGLMNFNGVNSNIDHNGSSHTKRSEQELIDQLQQLLNDNEEEIIFLKQVVSKQDAMLAGFRYDFLKK